MISESSFAAVFGAAVPGGEDSLVHLARYAIRAGFAIVPCLPGTKQPMCTLPSRDVKRADTEAQEAARAAGQLRYDRVRHACGVKHAITAEKDSDRILRRLIRDHGRVNLGVELGISRVIVVDVDTIGEREGFEASWLEATGSPLPHAMTVQSPGVYGPDGGWKHKHGGHYWFALPEGLVLPSDDGAMKDESGWIAMWANRQVLVPPSVREEGAYLLTGDIHPAPMWLIERIVDYITARRRRSAERETRRATRVEGQEPQIDAWSTSTEWGAILEPDGWWNTGLPDSCGCEIWTAPGVHASPKSATAHDVGCAAYDDSPGHAPLHVWTDNPPEFLMTGGKTFTKIQYVALRDHSGNIEQACRAEGIAREIPQLTPVVAAFAQSYSGAGAPPGISGGPTFQDQGTSSFPGRGPAGVEQWEDSTGIGWVPPTSETREGAVATGLRPVGTPPDFEQWADEHEDQLTADELTERGWEPRLLTGIPAPSELPVAPSLGVGDGVMPPLPEPGAPTAAPVYDPATENLVWAEVQRLFLRSEAERRWTEIKYPYASKVAARGFQPMRDVLAAAAVATPEFLVEDWIRRGSYAVLGAEYKAGKTFLAKDMGLSIATGTKFLGLIPTKLGRVAMMHNEGDYLEFVDRLRAIAEAKRIVLDEEVLSRMMFQEGASKLDRPEDINRLYDNLAEFKPDLITIDPWYMSAGDEADGKTLSKMGTVLSNLQGVAQELGAALLVTAHWNKSGDGKGVSRWSGSGLAEWGRVLINVAVDKYTPARPYAEDKTRRTTVDLNIDLTGQVSGSYRVHREVWRDDARDLKTPMRYLVAAHEIEDAASDTAAPTRDVTMGERERLLRVFAVSTTGLTKTKSIQTARGTTTRGRAMTIWNEAFDELVNAGHIEDVGDVAATTAAGLDRPGGYAKFAVTPAGQAEVERINQNRARAGSTETFTGIRPPTTVTETEEKDHHE